MVERSGNADKESAEASATGKPTQEEEEWKRVDTKSMLEELDAKINAFKARFNDMHLAFASAFV